MPATAVAHIDSDVCERCGERGDTAPVIGSFYRRLCDRCALALGCWTIRRDA